MNYGEIKFNDIANGEGVRTSLFRIGLQASLAKIVLMSKHGILPSVNRLQRKRWRKFWIPAIMIG